MKQLSFFLLFALLRSPERGTCFFNLFGLQLHCNSFVIMSSRPFLDTAAKHFEKGQQPIGSTLLFARSQEAAL